MLYPSARVCLYLGVLTSPEACVIKSIFPSLAEVSVNYNVEQITTFHNHASDAMLHSAVLDRMCCTLKYRRRRHHRHRRILFFFA